MFRFCLQWNCASSIVFRAEKKKTMFKRVITGCFKNGVTDSQPSQLVSRTKISLYILLYMSFLTLLLVVQSQGVSALVIGGVVCQSFTRLQPHGTQGSCTDNTPAWFGGDTQKEKTTLALSPWTKGAKPAIKKKRAAIQSGNMTLL